MREELLKSIIDEIECAFDGYDTHSEIRHKDIVESSKNAGKAVMGIVEKKIKILTEALDFYGDEKLYYQRPFEIDLNQTSAVLKEDYRENNDLTKPNIFKSINYECSAKIKMDQGKRAREAKEQCK